MVGAERRIFDVTRQPRSAVLQVFQRLDWMLR
jgi:hypothetical protein